MSTLTDNAAVYTSRFTGGRNGFEYLLVWLGIRQKHGMPGHPQTQGKVERFQQTLKRWLAHQLPARDLAELQAQLDTFRARYNEQLHHLRVGAIHAGRRVLAIVDEHEVTVVALDTGELLSTHRIEPDRGYWRNTQRDPGRWPGSQATG